MPDLANLDQALMHILDDCGVVNTPEHMLEMVLEAMRRAYAMAERKNELARQFIKGGE